MNLKQLPLECLAWKPPITKEKHLEELVTARLVPDKAIGHWRAPKGDMYLGAGGQEIVMFTSFV
jgi:hypothetical protein